MRAGHAAPPPDAVRVWRGFLSPAMTPALFMERLNTTFIPATVLMQIQAGLDAYIPTVLAGLPGKPPAAPDETAILFWDSQQTYRDAFELLAVRTYTLIHDSVYTPHPQSGAEFPRLFAGELEANQPYCLFEAPADWMHGSVSHLAGARPQDVTPGDFHAQAAAVLAAVRSEGGPAGAIFCTGDDYFVYWELHERHASEGSSVGVERLGQLCDWKYLAEAQPLGVEKGLWDRWAGLAVVAGDSLNMQFKRRWEQ